MTHFTIIIQLISKPHLTSLTPPLPCIEVPVSNQEHVWSCICVLVLLILRFTDSYYPFDIFKLF